MVSLLRRAPRAPAGQPACVSRDYLHLSAADLAHRPARPDEAGVVDSVLEFLVPDRVANQPAKLAIARRRAQRTAQVPLAAREQARPQTAVRRQPDSIAGRAEGLADRAD